MDKKRLAVVVFVLMFFGLVFSQFYYSSESGSGDTVNASFSVNGSNVSWAMLEVADNDTERRIGLMNRTELGKHEGMVFVYSEEGDRSFWMKNTLIPLDIIFLDSEKEVINVERAFPEPNTSDEDLTRYRSERPAKYVVEVNSGFADNYSISRGTKVTWDR